MPKAADQNIIELSNALTRGDVAGALKALGLPPGVGGETPTRRAASTLPSRHRTGRPRTAPRSLLSCACAAGIDQYWR